MITIISISIVCVIVWSIIVIDLYRTLEWTLEAYSNKKSVKKKAFLGKKVDSTWEITDRE